MLPCIRMEKEGWKMDDDPTWQTAEEGIDRLHRNARNAIFARYQFGLLCLLRLAAAVFGITA